MQHFFSIVPADPTLRHAIPFLEFSKRTPEPTLVTGIYWFHKIFTRELNSPLPPLVAPLRQALPDHPHGERSHQLVWKLRLPKNNLSLIICARWLELPTLGPPPHIAFSSERFESWKLPLLCVFCAFFWFLSLALQIYCTETRQQVDTGSNSSSRDRLASPLDHTSLALSNSLNKGSSQSSSFATALLQAVFLSFVPKGLRI